MSSALAPETTDHVSSFMTIRKYVAYLKHSSRSRNNETVVEFGQGSAAKLVADLRKVWSLFCYCGKVELEDNLQPKDGFRIFKNSTFSKLDVAELLAHAKQSAFGHGTETVTDTSVRNSFEIDASEFVTRDVKGFASNHLFYFQRLCPDMRAELRPYKLVIYQAGGHFDEHRDTVRGEGHIGTLVLILNSEYTGGELKVTHGGRTETVTGAYSWVAMYGDCLHKINQVTSGTRVSLIYDIYKVGGGDGGGEESTCGTEEEEENEGDQEEDLEFKLLDADEEAEFWDIGEADDVMPVLVAVREVKTKVKKSVIEGVAKELKQVDNLIITLSHLYPECQTSPAFLKGGDRALYDLLSEQFDVQVVAATIYRTHHDTYKDSNCIRYDLFSPSILTQALEDMKKPQAYNPPTKKQKTEQLPRTKIVIPHYLCGGNVLDYTPYVEYTGNESQAEETIYIVAGLQVRKKE